MKFRSLPVALVGALVTCAAVAGAPPRPAAPPHHPASLEQAVKQVQHQTHGHILAADTVSRGRTQVYRIKVLKPDGKVQVMQLNSKPRPQGHPTESGQGGH
ncbi:MAG: PepSY domain-containing protein [Rhodanobacteraceae bacterium]